MDEVEAGAAHADAGWDNYHERVLRNEGRLMALEGLVSETRAADIKLVEQTTESLRQLMAEQRRADREAWQTQLQAAKDLTSTNRAEDEKARLLQADEYARRLEVLNHAHQRQLEFQNNSVTRELWQASEDTWNQREKADHDKMAALDRAVLGMTPLATSERAHEQIALRIEDMGERLAKTSEARIDALTEKINDLKEAQASMVGKSAGYANLYGWAVGGLGLIITAIVLANALTSAR